MGLLDKAKDAAEQAKQRAAEMAGRPDPNAPIDPDTVPLPPPGQVLGQQLKAAAKFGKSSISTLVEKIDPGLLADLIIKATAAQEKANIALKSKGSPYRIAEITITATIPPQIGFAVARVEDVVGDDSEEAHSLQLVEAGEAMETPVVSLEGDSSVVPE